MIFPCVPPGPRNIKIIVLVHLQYHFWLLCQIYTMHILKHYSKPQNKTDNSNFTEFVMKIGPVLDLQELPARWWNVCYQRGLPRLVLNNKAIRD